MTKNSQQLIKAIWEYVPSDDAESRIAAAFDMLFDKELETDRQTSVSPVEDLPVTQ